MTPAEAAKYRRIGSGATNPPAPPPPKPRIVAVPGPPLPVAPKPEPGTPEAILAKCSAQRRVFQWLNERALSGDGQLPSANLIGYWLRMSDDQINASICKLARNGLLKVERNFRKISAIQIVKSGRWLCK